MTNANKQDSDFFNKIFKDNKLGEGDFFKHKHFIIFTRSGIEKIIDNNQILITEKLEGYGENFATFSGTATMGETPITTYASSNDRTNKSGYHTEVALKRLRSRLTLMIMKMYNGYTFGEDEGVQYDDPNIRASNNQIAYIETLMDTSLCDEDEKDNYIREFDQMTEYRAKEITEYLKDNQQDPIKQGGNPSKTDIKNYAL